MDSNPGLGPRGPGFPARRDALVGVFAGVCETGVAPACCFGPVSGVFGGAGVVWVSCGPGWLLVSVGGGGAWPGFEIDHSEPSGSRVAIERAGRRPRTQKSSKQAAWQISGWASAHGHKKQPETTGVFYAGSGSSP